VASWLEGEREKEGAGVQFGVGEEGHVWSRGRRGGGVGRSAVEWERAWGEVKEVGPALNE
jgi:hypothetical protein